MAEESGINFLNDPSASSSAAAALAPLVAHSILDEVFGTGTLNRLHKRGAGIQSTVRRTGFSSTSVPPLLSTKTVAVDALLKESVEAGLRNVRPAGRLVGSTIPATWSRASSDLEVAGVSDVNLVAKLNGRPSDCWLELSW